MLVEQAPHYFSSNWAAQPTDPIKNSKGEIRTLDLTDCAEAKRLIIVLREGAVRSKRAGRNPESGANVI